MEPFSKFLLPGSLLVLTLVFGVWLSLAGKPYNGILFNIHKLIALATVVLTVIEIYQVLKNTHPEVGGIVLLIMAGICIIALFATGAMMSIGAPNQTLVLTVHRIMIFLLVSALAGSVILIKQRMAL